MKIKITAAILVSMLFTISSCTDLDEQLYDRVEDGNFGNTPKEIDALVGGAYSSLRGFADGISNNYPTCEYVFFLNETVSDEAVIPTRGTNWYDGGQYQDAQKHTQSRQPYDSFGLALQLYRNCKNQLNHLSNR